MEIFVNKMDMSFSGKAAVDPGGQPFFFIKCWDNRHGIPEEDVSTPIAW